MDAGGENLARGPVLRTMRAANEDFSRIAATDPSSILAAIDAVVYDWDIVSDALIWGPNVERTLSDFPAARLATGAEFTALISSESDASRFHAIQNSLVADDGQGAPYRVRYTLASPKGERLEVEDVGRWFADSLGRPCRAHGVMRVLSRSTAPTIANTSVPDGQLEQTLCSRRAFNAWIDARCEDIRQTELSFAVLIVGLVNLAAVNRREGYDAADELVRAVGQRLAKSIRAYDKVVRFSGGKFAVAVALTGNDQLEVAMSRFARVVGEGIFPTSAGGLRAQIRIGAALAPRHGRNAHLLLQRADEAFEQSVVEQRPFVVYEANRALCEARQRETRAADEIVGALNERRLVLAFQPVEPARANLPPFEEALARIRHEDGAHSGPSEFLAVAERAGLIELLDERVLDLTLDALAAAPDRRLSMNVSVNALRAPAWLDRIRGQLRNNLGAAGRLIVEINERQRLDEIEDTAKALQAMKDLGAKIAIDDFGAGHASFRHLRALGVDMVKIDGAFVQNLGRSLDDRFFVRTLASVAQHLRLETVAKWVEDAETANLLTRWGVDYLQGHAIAPVRLELQAMPNPPAAPMRNSA